MKKVIILLICLMVLSSCTSSSTEKEATTLPITATSAPTLDEETILGIIKNLEQKGFRLFYADSSGWIMEDTGTFIFTEDDNLYFINSTYGITIQPVVGYFATEHAKCGYAYNYDEILDNSICTDEDIDSGKKVLNLMEMKLIEFELDINSVKETLKYVRDNKYVISLSQENKNEVKEGDQLYETVGQKNALETAIDYLDYTSFSYKGLIKQLEYEGYTNEEAIYAVDKCGADWNEQSKKAAQSYLDYSSFSREKLIEQLIYEGFTTEEAEYGVSAVGY